MQTNFDGGMLSIMAAFVTEVFASLAGHSQQISFKKGEAIVKEGQRLPGIHIVRKGTVRVVRRHLGQEVLIATLGAGESFGEVSFLDEGGASASIIANDDTQIDFVSHATLSKLFTSCPELAANFYRALALALAERLRETSAMIPMLLKDAERRSQAPSR